MNVVPVPASRHYEVKIGRGLLQTLGAEAARISSGQVLVVSDSNVAPRYLDAAVASLREAQLRVCTLVLPAGETSKNLEHYSRLLLTLAREGFTRADAVVALGGGVVGDLAGFAASTYLRGIAVIQVPTTLLSMVDSSVGGKTAIDLPMGKNLVGTFHQPALVLCDIATLDTLPEAVFLDGCAEVIKTAILFDRPLFDHLKAHGPAFDRELVISRCVKWKRDTVCADEFDTGERQKLNLGHTVGHAIEACSGFSLSHGRAVSIGTAIVSRALCPEAEEICALLRAFGLPVHTEFSPEELATRALSDKKRAGDCLTLVVPQAIGTCVLKKIPVGTLAELIKAGL